MFVVWVHASLICQDHRVALWFEETLFFFLFTPFFEDFSTAQPFLLQQVNNQLVHDFFSQQNNRLSSSFWAYGFICGWPRPVSSRSAKQPGWRSPPIVTIVTIICGWPRPVSSRSAKQPGWRSPPIVTIVTIVVWVWLWICVWLSMSSFASQWML